MFIRLSDRLRHAVTAKVRRGWLCIFRHITGLHQWRLFTSAHRHSVPQGPTLCIGWPDVARPFAPRATVPVLDELINTPEPGADFQRQQKLDDTRGCAEVNRLATVPSANV
jgi:hypothetical protein